MQGGSYMLFSFERDFSDAVVVTLHYVEVA